MVYRILTYCKSENFAYTNLPSFFFFCNEVSLSNIEYYKPVRFSVYMCVKADFSFSSTCCGQPNYMSIRPKSCKPFSPLVQILTWEKSVYVYQHYKLLLGMYFKTFLILQNPPLSLTKSQPIVSTGITNVAGATGSRFSARASIRSWGRSNLNGSSTMMESKENGIIPFLQQALAIR